MCCTFKESKMSNTRIYVGQAERQGKLVHVLAYQNTAISNSPNAMVLPFPTSTKMGQENVIDTREFKDFLTDITNASKEVTKGSGSRRMLGSRGEDDSFAEVFDSGSYTIVLADNVWQIPEALSRVSADKRPNVTSDFLIGYNELYPEQPIAVCCWNGNIEAEPLMWWYEPRDSKTLFIPTMDAHNGKAPKVGELVTTDHIISVGSTDSNVGNKVHYSQPNNIPSEVKSLLPFFVHGNRLLKHLENGDCFVETAYLHSTKEQLFSAGVPGVRLKRGSFWSTVMKYWH